MKDYLELHNKVYYIQYDELLIISTFQDPSFKELKCIPNEYHNNIINNLKKHITKDILPIDLKVKRPLSLRKSKIFGKTKVDNMYNRGRN